MMSMWSPPRFDPRAYPSPLSWGLYLLYTASLADILRYHEMQFHFCVDDTQLLISLSTNNDVKLTNTVGKIEKSLSELDKWMSLNKLKLNKDKTKPAAVA